MFASRASVIIVLCYFFCLTRLTVQAVLFRRHVVWPQQFLPYFTKEGTDPALRHLLKDPREQETRSAILSRRIANDIAELKNRSRNPPYPPTTLHQDADVARAASTPFDTRVLKFTEMLYAAQKKAGGTTNALKDPPLFKLGLPPINNSSLQFMFGALRSF